MHIPKTAGTSVYKQLKPQGVRFKDVSPGGDEKCFYSILKEGGQNVAAFFRRPEEHVYSLYLECKYDGWGKMMTKNTGFPRGSDENITIGRVPDFERWLDHFRNKGTPAKRGPWYDYYNCSLDLPGMKTRFQHIHDICTYPKHGHMVAILRHR